MKTPRQILLKRHGQTVPRLDTVRRNALLAIERAPDAERLSDQAADRSARTALSHTRLGSGRLGPVLQQFWRQLIWPSRYAWAGMAAVWLAVWAANARMNRTLSVPMQARTAPAGELARAFQEQRKLLAELLPAPEPRPTRGPEPAARPRSERTVQFKACQAISNYEHRPGFSRLA